MPNRFLSLVELLSLVTLGDRVGSDSQQLSTRVYTCLHKAISVPIMIC
jgi:hypothetical protein